MFDYLVVYESTALQAGIDTSTLRKDVTGLKCIIHRELVTATQFNVLLIMAMMSGKPYSVGTKDDIYALMLTSEWSNTQADKLEN